MSLLPPKGLCCGIHIHNVRSSAAASSYRTLNPTRSNPPPLQTAFSPLEAAGLFLRRGERWKKLKAPSAGVPVPQPLDLTEDNVRQVLVEARGELGQIFDTTVGMTGTVELAELDGPFVKITLKGRFWHQRSMVVARVANYLKQRIPEILEVDIEEEKQLDDSPASF